MNLRGTAIAWLLSSALAAPALAQVPAQQVPAAPAEDPLPAIPEYKVEIIVFAYASVDPLEERLDHRNAPLPPALGTPLERRPPPVFDDTTLAPLTQELDDPLVESPPAATTPFRFRRLEPAELTLTREYAALERIDAYVPLVHGGWVQQGLPEADARPFDLALLGVLNPRGSIRLHLSRFLHLRLDLTYQAAGPQAFPAQPVFGDNVLAELPLAPRYTLRTERRTSSGELHYFDHPGFGVLVLVTPLPPDAVPVGPGLQPAA